MSEIRIKIPADALTPGQFFFVNDRWYRAADKPIDLGNGRQIRATSPVSGATSWMWLYTPEVAVTEGNTVPATFRSATLARKAKAAREKAQEFARTADQLEALSIEMDFVARQTANA